MVDLPRVWKVSLGCLASFYQKTLNCTKLLTNWENKFILAHNAPKTTYIETSTARCHSGMTNDCHVFAAIPKRPFDRSKGWLHSMSARTEKENCLNRLELAQQSRSDAKYSCLDRFQWKAFSAGRHFKSKPLAFCWAVLLLLPELDPQGIPVPSRMGETLEACGAVRSRLLENRTSKAVSVASRTEERKTTEDVLLCPPSLFRSVTPSESKSLANHHVYSKLMVNLFLVHFTVYSDLILTLCHGKRPYISTSDDRRNSCFTTRGRNIILNK